MFKISEKQFKFFARRYIPSVVGIYETEEPDIQKIYTEEFRAARKDFRNIRPIAIKFSTLENIVNLENNKISTKNILLIGNGHIMDCALNTDEIKIRSFFQEILSRQTIATKTHHSQNKINTHFEGGNKNQLADESHEILSSNIKVSQKIYPKQESSRSEILQKFQNTKRRIKYNSIESPSNNFFLPLKYGKKVKDRSSTLNSIKFDLNMKCDFILPYFKKSSRERNSASKSNISQISNDLSLEVNSPKNKTKFTKYKL